MSAKKALGNRRSIVPLLCTPSKTSDNGLVVTTVTPADLPINDDEAERLATRKNRGLELQHDRRLSTVKQGDSHSCNFLSGFTTAQLAEHYNDCITLSAENVDKEIMIEKITVKNAFGLHLIDYMVEMLKEKDSEMNNFQVASCTLDASTKIYACRVDCVHAETQKIACGLSRSSVASKDKRSSSDNELNGEHGGGDEENRDRPKKKKTEAKKGRTIEQNVKALNATKFDLQLEVDPLFRKATELFADAGAGGGGLLSSLCCRDDNCELVLDSMDPIEKRHSPIREQSKSQQEAELVDVTGFAAIFRRIASGTTKICPPFADFEFGSWKPGDTLGSNWEFGADIRSDLHNGSNSPDDDDDGGHDYNSDLADVGMESNGERMVSMTPAPVPQVQTETPEIVNEMDLTQMLTTEPNEYSYFSKDFESAWAGPNHWHVRPLSKGITLHGGEAKERRPRNKKPAIKLDYDVDPDELQRHFIKTKSAVTLSKTTVKQWSAEDIVLPDDIHYDAKKLCQLFVKPSIVVQQKHPCVQNADADVGNYDYNNANDVENFCPAIADDRPISSFSGSDNVPSPTTSRGFPESNVDFDTQIDSQDGMIGQTITAFTGENLVQQPWRVAKFNIPYTRMAKHINIRRLKENIWNLLNKNQESRAVKQQEQAMETEYDPNFNRKKDQSFRDIYHHLTIGQSPEMAENLSVPIAFACMLHLANEKNLQLLQQTDMKDFKIQFDAANSFL